MVDLLALRKQSAPLAADSVSVMYCPVPFSVPAVVVVMPENTASIRTVLITSAEHLKRSMSPICVRETELWELAIPDSYGHSGDCARTLTLSYWLRYSGTVVHGKDLRKKVPVYEGKKDFLSHRLDYLCFYIRSQVILSCLAKQNYSQLLACLDKERSLLMLILLYLRQVRRVYPSTLRREFSIHCSNRAMADNLVEFDEVNHYFAHASSREKEKALRAAWLFEVFVRLCRES
jgi:hypothetical protein